MEIEKKKNQNIIRKITTIRRKQRYVGCADTFIPVTIIPPTTKVLGDQKNALSLQEIEI